MFYMKKSIIVINWNTYKILEFSPWKLKKSLAFLSFSFCSQCTQRISLFYQPYLTCPFQWRLMHTTYWIFINYGVTYIAYLNKGKRKSDPLLPSLLMRPPTKLSKPIFSLNIMHENFFIATWNLKIRELRPPLLFSTALNNVGFSVVLCGWWDPTSRLDGTMKLFWDGPFYVVIEKGGLDKHVFFFML